MLVTCINMDLTDMVRKFITRILAMPLIGSAAIVIICTIALVWRPYTYAVSTLESCTTQLMNNYHSYLQVVDSEDHGTALQQKPPLWTLNFGIIQFSVIIDTSNVDFQSVTDSIKDFSHAVAISHDFIVVKYDPRFYIWPAPYLSGTMIKSQNISQIVSHAVFAMRFWLALSLMISLLVSTTIFVTFCGLAVHFVGRNVFSIYTTLHQNLNLATLSLIPPVISYCVTVKYYSVSFGSVLYYFLIYIVTLTMMTMTVYFNKSHLPHHTPD